MVFMSNALSYITRFPFPVPIARCEDTFDHFIKVKSLSLLDMSRYCSVLLDKLQRTTGVNFGNKVWLVRNVSECLLFVPQSRSYVAYQRRSGPAWQQVFHHLCPIPTLCKYLEKAEQSRSFESSGSMETQWEGRKQDVYIYIYIWDNLVHGFSVFGENLHNSRCSFFVSCTRKG